MGRRTSDRPRGIWPDIPSTTLLTKTEVSIREELDEDNVEGGETDIGARRIHLMETRRLIYGRPTGT